MDATDISVAITHAKDFMILNLSVNIMQLPIVLLNSPAFVIISVYMTNNNLK